MFKNKKNQLDEMQEQRLLHIERNGCWFVFWALLAAIVIQMIVYKEDAAERIAGEWIVFMCLAVYIGVACIKNGIWDRKLEPTPKVNAGISLLAGVITGIILGVYNYVQFGFVTAAIWVGIINIFCVGIICFVGLTVVMMIYKKRLEKMEMEEEA